MNKLIAGKASIWALAAAVAVASFVLSNSTKSVSADAGSIWTTTSSCGAPQDANHYVAGEHVYIHGSGFTANTLYAWDINTVPASTAVASGNHSTDGSGDVCFDAYTIGANDSGVYKASFGGKTDNYSVVSATATPTPTASPTATPTSSPTASPTASPTSSPTASPTTTPTSTPEPCREDCEATPTPAPTPTPGDQCTNLDGFQSKVPDGWFQISAGSTICRQFSYGGPPTPGESQGQVLGASTMAGTGSFAEYAYLAIMGLGGALTTLGFKNTKKALKKA